MVALATGYFLIPAYGLVGAALSMLCYNIFAIVLNNGYLIKMGLWPYSSKLISQVVWILILIVFYIMLNMQVFTLTLLEKVFVYVGVLAVLGIYWKIMKKRIEADRNAHAKN